MSVYLLHLSVEIRNCSRVLLNSPEELDCSLTNICREMEITVLSKIKHCFSPSGVSIVYILSASHLALHTWPGKGVAHLDLISCTKKLPIDQLKNSIIKNFKTESIEVYQNDH